MLDNRLTRRLSKTSVMLIAMLRQKENEDYNKKRLLFIKEVVVRVARLIVSL